MKKTAAILCIAVFMFSPVFASENEALQIEGYEKGKELPSWAKDLRRAEIVTLGSLPFTTLGTTLVYSLYRYGANDFKPAYIPNPFPLSSAEAKLSTNEQIGIIATAAGISLAVGLTDFIVMQVKQSRKKKALEKIREEQGTVIRIREAVNENQIPKNQNGSTE
ncbi:hypothetical protein V1L52_09025 [Treponema sp. HNW]|uniref:hypothetical protein n=1 Tax=Treponema sp. HNW TaxID=3116654 RepID=UPI003D1192DD